MAQDYAPQAKAEMDRSRRSVEPDNSLTWLFGLFAVVATGLSASTFRKMGVDPESTAD